MKMRPLLVIQQPLVVPIVHTPNERDEALTTLGRGWGYLGAKIYANNIPRVMLKLNEGLLMGRGGTALLEMESALHLSTERYFQENRHEPSELIERLIARDLISCDRKWSFISRGIGIGQKQFRKLHSDPPANLSRLSSNTVERLKEDGWEYLATSVRVIFRQGNTILKIATSLEGIEQNKKEAHFLRMYGKIPTENETVWHKHAGYELAFPKLFGQHQKFMWTTSYYVNHPGIKHPSKELIDTQDYRDIAEAFRTKFRIKDVRDSNLLIEEDPKRFWMIDVGLIE